MLPHIERTAGTATGALVEELSLSLHLWTEADLFIDRTTTVGSVLLPCYRDHKAYIALEYHVNSWSCIALSSCMANVEGSG